MRYQDFDLLIEPSDPTATRYRVRVLDSDAAGQVSGEFVLPFSVLELENFLLRMGRPRRSVRGRRDSPELAAAKEFGSRLYRAFFKDQVQVAFSRSLDAAQNAGQGLRVRLRLTGAPRLIDLPFVAAGGYQQDQWWTKAGIAWRNTNQVKQPLYWDDPTWNQGNYPVVGISWYEAYAYANWLAHETRLTIRLPTEAEWEKAARGTDGRIYPWGNAAPTDELLNYNDNLGHTTLVGSYPAGKSFYGALDMAGNAREWTYSQYKQYPYSSTDNRESPEGVADRVLRGGSWHYGDLDVRTAARDWFAPIIINDAGVRVVVVVPQ